MEQEVVDSKEKIAEIMNQIMMADDPGLLDQITEILYK